MQTESYSASPDEGSGDAPVPNAQEQREDTFFLPQDYPGAENLKEGDKVTLLVVGKDADGNVEVECDPKAMAGHDTSDFKTDLANLDMEEK